MEQCGREGTITPLELQLYAEQIPLNPSSRASRLQTSLAPRAGWFCVVWGYPVRCRMCSCIPGPYSLNVSSTAILPPVVADKHFSRNYQVSPGWQNHPQLRTPALTSLGRELALTVLQLPLESPLTVLSDGDILCQFPRVWGTQSERIIPLSPQALSKYFFSFKTISSLETPTIAGPPTMLCLSAIH